MTQTHDTPQAVPSGLAVSVDLSRLSSDVTELLGAIADEAADFVAVAHLEGGVLWVSRAGRALVGLEADDALEHVTILDFVGDDEIDPVVSSLADIENSGLVADSFTFRHVRTGAAIPMRLVALLVQSRAPAEGEVYRVLVGDRRTDTQDELRSLLHSIAAAAHTLGHDQPEARAIIRETWRGLPLVRRLGSSRCA